ncbi:hypothetical protein L7F22_020683 [Adiantum nelumboides]|nr:hypothetical protein [Adiantum nelumboides]
MDHELEELHLQSFAVGESMSRSKRFLMGNNVDASSIEEALASIEKGMPASSTPQFIIDSIANILHRCHKAKNPSYVTRVYACMQERGLDVHRSLGNHLVSLLVDAGSVHSAHQVFDKLPYRSECSWTSLINGYIKHGKPQQALSLYATNYPLLLQKGKWDGTLINTRVRQLALLIVQRDEQRWQEAAWARPAYEASARLGRVRAAHPAMQHYKLFQIPYQSWNLWAPARAIPKPAPAHADFDERCLE